MSPQVLQFPAASDPASEFLRYLACSALALAVDTAVFWLTLRLGAPLWLAAGLGFIAGLGIAYGLSVTLVFATRRLLNRRTEFTLFLLIGVFGLLLTEGLLWALVTRHGFTPLMAKLLAVGPAFGCNFVLRKTILFSLSRGHGQH